MHIGEVLVAGGGWPRILGAVCCGMRRLVLRVERPLRGRIRLWLRLGWRGLLGRRRRHDRCGLLRRLGRRWLDLLWCGRWRLGFLGGGVSGLDGGGGGASFAAGWSLGSRLASFISVSPRSSEAMRPGGGGLNSGFGGRGDGGVGGGGGGGGSNTSWTAIGSTTGGAAIGHSISNSNGSRCSKSEVVGPSHRVRSRAAIGVRRSGGASREGSGDTRRGAPVSVGSRRSRSGAAAMRNTVAGHPAARASQSASSSNLTPSAAAFVAFEPGSAPATT